MTKVLIADDEANLRKVLRALLTQEGYQACAVSSGSEALAAVQAGGIDVLITDLRMPGMSGLEVLERVKVLDPSLPVIMITAHGSVDTAVSALKSGALDYITKPFDREELKIAVRKASSVRLAAQHELLDPGDPRGRFRIIGQSPAMHGVFAVIEKVAATPSTVLITGDSGTGKELVVSALHEQSSRKDKPIVKVNCAAIPKELMESEFFGYERGAFTGAVSSKPGRFELADGGTLFLDEIAEIPIAMQVKLLRALQECEFERVGGVRTIRVDVRLVAATNRDLAQEVTDGRFREDLYYRLNVVPVHLPALRERPEDIPLLVEAFIEKCNQRLERSVRGIDADALAALAAYSWPGNIRELENVIERTLLFTDGERISRADLPEHLRKGRNGPSLQTQAAQKAPAEGGNASMKEIVRQATEKLERDLIVKALEKTGGNVTKAAILLRISRKGLQNKMKELALRES